MVIKMLGVSFIVFCLICPSGRADLVITEVMANEPGDQNSLQWIEIYNNDPNPRFLSLYQLYIDGQPATALAGSINPYEYRVIAKKLNSSEGEAGFEEVWGNNDGVWIRGAPPEDYDVFEYTGLELNDAGGTVALYRVQDLISDFTWTQAGLDGVSWERYSVSTQFVGNCTAPEGGTPGHTNSVNLRQFDLAIEEVKIEPAAYGLTNLEITLSNKGIQPYDEGLITLSYDPDADGVVLPEDLIGYIPYPGLAADETVYLLAVVEIEGVYNYVNFQSPEDDWPQNNNVTQIAPGKEFPPVILNEIMVDPKAPLGTEWVEVINRSDLTVDLNGWTLGNADVFYPITSCSLQLGAGQLMVLCKDSLAFVDFYGPGEYPIREPAGWPTLRNDGDSIFLTDNFGFEADAFIYGSGFGDNYTWGRYNQSVTDVVWGQSRDIGGTPGRENLIYPPPSASEIEITIEPNPFSYSRDENVHIDMSVPDGEAMSMRVYDRDGRVVRTLIDNARPYNESLDWDGYTDGGRPLPPGIYILYVEVSGSGSFKKTMVLSP